MVERPVETDGTAEVVHDQRQRASRTDRVDEPAEPARVVLGSVAGSRRALGQAEPEVIDGDHPMGRAEAGDHVPPLEAPRRGAVHEQHRRALALVYVVLAPVAGVDRARGVRPGGAIEP